MWSTQLYWHICDGTQSEKPSKIVKIRILINWIDKPIFCALWVLRPLDMIKFIAQLRPLDMIKFIAQLIIFNITYPQVF